jgi:hypothetical protein
MRRRLRRRRRRRRKRAGKRHERSTGKGQESTELRSDEEVGGRERGGG